MAETSAKRLSTVRARGTWTDVERAHDVFIDILLRLPTKTIWSFRSVSKYWYHSIRSNFFAKLHLAKSRETPSYVACPRMGRKMELYSMKPESLNRFHVNTIDPAKRNIGNHMYMVSSFNGLICCINHISDQEGLVNEFWDLQIWVINPCTGETLLLPQGRPSFACEPSVGVAYGSDMSDYKVFRIFSVGTKIPEEVLSITYCVQEGQIVMKKHLALAYECEVYSSSTGVWENNGTVPCAPMDSRLGPFRSNHVFVRGKIYWLSSLEDPGAILSVDLEGRFGVISLPYYDTTLRYEDRITEATYLINMRGSLTLVVRHPKDMDIWSWEEEDGENFSWEPVCQVRTPLSKSDLVFAMSSLKNQILCVTEKEWCYYNMETRTWKRRRVNSAGFVNPALFPFTESLLPCNGGVML